MKIAIISDIHDNLANLKKALDWCRGNGISRLICCGDLTNSDSLAFLAGNFPGQIYLVEGNVELYEEKEIPSYKNIIFLGKSGIINLDKKVIGVCHEPRMVEELKKKSQYDIIFFGHTHKPWIDQKGVRTVNPGTLGGVFQKATFAVWDSQSDELELKILEIL